MHVTPSPLTGGVEFLPTSAAAAGTAAPEDVCRESFMFHLALCVKD